MKTTLLFTVRCTFVAQTAEVSACCIASLSFVGPGLAEPDMFICVGALSDYVFLQVKGCIAAWTTE